jgi:hypothetical protein
VFKAAQQDLVNLRSNSHPPADARPGGSFDSRFQSFEPSGSTFGPQGISPVKLSAAFAAEQDVESQGYLGKYPITQTHRDFQAHAQAQQAQLTLPPIDPLNYVALISTSANPQSELMKTIESLGAWLQVVDEGFAGLLEGQGDAIQEDVEEGSEVGSSVPPSPAPASEQDSKGRGRPGREESELAYDGDGYES